MDRITAILSAHGAALTDVVIIMAGHRYRNFAAHSHGWDYRHAQPRADLPATASLVYGITNVR
jgi:hypothetical protein